MSALLDLLAPPDDEPQAERATAPRPPSGWQPRAEWDDTHADITSEPWEAGTPEPAEAELLAERGLDDGTWTVASVRYSEWQQSKRLENGDRDTVTLQAKRVTFTRTNQAGRVDPDHLVQLLATSRQHPPVIDQAGAPVAYVHAGGDYQLGKLDGDGIDGTVARFRASIVSGLDRLRLLRDRGHNITTVYLPHLGDCIEGYVSQGGKNTLRTGLALTEQVDLLCLLLTEQVRAYADHAARVVVPVVPGNHDEAMRQPVDGLEHDSWAVFAAQQLRRSLRLAGSAYDHVSVVTPGRGELTVTLDIAGTVTTMAHGHQWPTGKAVEWLNGQAGGMQLAGEAMLLLSAHNHYLHVQQPGARTAVQVPALEGESRWWRHRKGQQSPPGMVTMLVGDSLGRSLVLPDGRELRTGWSELEVV